MYRITNDSIHNKTIFKGIIVNFFAKNLWSHSMKQEKSKKYKRKIENTGGTTSQSLMKIYR